MPGPKATVAGPESKAVASSSFDAATVARALLALEGRTDAGAAEQRAFLTSLRGTAAEAHP